jgi:hypothetical protein
MRRRDFLTASLLAAVSAAFAADAPPGESARPRRILLRSSWQTVNIGDIAHTPGVLHLLEQHLPEVEVRLWPSNVGDGVEEMLRKRFPRLIIVKGAEALKAALAECDFLLHGSGPSLVAANDVARWRQETGKPYGIYGITLPDLLPKTLDLINGARFAFFRDTVSLALAKEKGATCPVMEFGPDGAFATDLRDDAAADDFLKANGLEPGRFLCCIPRLRYTPYWRIHGKEMNAEDKRRFEYNESKKEHDHAPLRAAIIAVAQQTPMKVLLCPEDRSQMEIGKEMLLDPLPAEVKAKVVWRERYWLTDEALSTYVRSAGLFGSEMHSPIMCVGNGIPAIVCRWKEQTSKGFMWRDIGLDEWLFDLDDEAQVARVADTVLAMAKDPAAAKAKAAAARAVVERRQRETLAVLRKQLP